MTATPPFHDLSSLVLGGPSSTCASNWRYRFVNEKCALWYEEALWEFIFELEDSAITIADYFLEHPVWSARLLATLWVRCALKEPENCHLYEVLTKILRLTRDLLIEVWFEAEESDFKLPELLSVILIFFYCTSPLLHCCWMVLLTFKYHLPTEKNFLIVGLGSILQRIHPLMETCSPHISRCYCCFPFMKLTYFKLNLINSC